MEYYLFLDESKPNTNFNNFTLAGFAISKPDYEEYLVPEVEKFKDDIFGDRGVILHECELRKLEGEFSSFNRNHVETALEKIGHILDDERLVVFGVSIDTNRLETKFRETYRNSYYHISLQIVLENYIHFLISKNAKGSVLIESRNGIEDTRMQNLYHNLIANGTLFYTKNTMQDKLQTISFDIKSSNNIGLQIADFIPNPIARDCLGKRQKNWSIITNIKNSLYDGDISRPDRFGLKIIP